MMLQTLPRPIVWPNIAVRVAAAPTFGANSVLSTAGDYEAAVIQAREDMVISHVGLRPHAVSGSPTADMRIETVDSSGNPSGTLWSVNTEIVTPALAADWSLHALTATATVTRGQVFALKCAYNSGTSLTTRNMSNFPGTQQGLPYQVKSISGVVTRAVLNLNSFALGSSASAFYGIEGLSPGINLANNTFNNTNSAERGVRFKVPFKCRVVGVRHFNNTATGDFNVVLRDDAGNELSSSSTAIDGDTMANLATAANNYYFDSPVILSPSVWYRLTLQPTSATNINITTLQLPSASYQSAMPGGANFFYTTFASAAWTDTATDKVPLMDLLVDQFDDGSGGLMINPGMSGGMR